MSYDPKNEVEVDWEPLQCAIDAMADAGLDLENHEEVVHHMAVFLGSFLKQTQEAQTLSGDDMAEMAAWIAGAAVEIAADVEDLPAFYPSDLEIDDYADD